jgi:transposase
VSTDEKCEECNGEMVKTGRFTYTCTICGLMQVRGKEKKEGNME